MNKINKLMEIMNPMGAINLVPQKGKTLYRLSFVVEDKVVANIKAINNCEQIDSTTYKLNGQYNFMEVETLKPYDLNVSCEYYTLMNPYIFYTMSIASQNNDQEKAIEILKEAIYNALEKEKEVLDKQITTINQAEQKVLNNNTYFYPTEK